MGFWANKLQRWGRKERKLNIVCLYEDKLVFLTNVLETDRTRGVVEVYTADVQRVQLGYVVPSYLQNNTGQRGSGVLLQASQDRSFVNC